MKREGVNFICGPAGRVAESAQEAGRSGEAGAPGSSSHGGSDIGG